MDEASGRKPDTEKYSDKLAKSNAVASSENVHVLENVGNRHQTDCS